MAMLEGETRMTPTVSHTWWLSTFCGESLHEPLAQPVLSWRCIVEFQE